MKNIYITEDVGVGGTKWFLYYKNPISGVSIEIDESDARDILKRL